MKFMLPLAAGLLLWPQAAGAQGYTGVMPPQQGFRAPPAATATPVYNGPGGHLDSPYSGTGASQESGHASVTDPGDAGAGEAGDVQTEAEMEVAPEPLAEDEDAAAPPTSAYTASFAPKEEAEDDGTAGASIYDTVNANAGTPAERKRKALLRKVEAAQKKAQRQIERVNAERARQTRAMVQRTLEEQRRKREGEDGEETEEAGYSDPAQEQEEGDLTDVHNK
ncbi:MAG: hypothetical protein EPN97_15205 [Alphaproteobacteria bacterium]|nr:MAG: hypothetical protein EPN97_15205 [Alphaproteobacteria bacterium]